jgi:hypothetical protein
MATSWLTTKLYHYRCNGKVVTISQHSTIKEELTLCLKTICIYCMVLRINSVLCSWMTLTGGSLYWRCSFCLCAVGTELQVSYGKHYTPDYISNGVSSLKIFVTKTNISCLNLSTWTSHSVLHLPPQTVQILKLKYSSCHFPEFIIV